MLIFRRFANLFARSRVEREIDAELRSHIDMRMEDNIAAGMSAEEARRDARIRFGNAAVMKERVTAMDASLAVANTWSDVRYGFRQLRRYPVFAITAIVTLALGIGATTAIFSVMNAVLLRWMPLPHPQELYYLHLPIGHPSGYGASQTGDDATSFSRPTFEYLRQDLRAFSEVMAFIPLSNDKVAVRKGDMPEEANGEMVSGNFFSGLGVRMRLGSGFKMEDEQHHAPLVVLSFAYWTHLYSRDPGVLGQALYIKGIPFAILGIAPEGFSGVEAGQSTDFWIPLQSRPELNPWGNSPDVNTLYGSPNWWCLRLIARLAPGVDAQRAVAEATPGFQAAAYASLGKPDPKQPKVTLSLVAAKGIQGLGDNYREPVLVLMALVTLVLLIACSNVAMLILARNASRRREFGVRMALGARRSTLLRQLLVESALLVVGGALLGWLFAEGATRALAAWSQLEVSLAPDGTVLLFAGTVSALAALVFSLAPLRAATNAPVIAALRATAATSYQKGRSGNAVLALQVALCFTLLMAAGLLLRTLMNYENTNLGMRTDGLLVFGIAPQQAKTNEAKFAFYRTLLERMRGMPEVESATFVETRLGTGWSSNDEPTVDGVKVSFEQVPLRTNDVGPDFLRTFGIPLLEGRDIRDTDTATSQHVVVVNETFVKKLLPHSDPIGHLLGNPKKHPYAIVGVARDSKYRSVDEAPRAMAYYPYTQDTGAPPTLQVELRTKGDPLSVLPAVERVIREMDPNIPLEKPMSQTAVFEDSYAQQRLFSRLAMFFGLLAALLVGIGLYGTLSYRISRRSTEIGVRMALGARQWQVLGMVMRESLLIAGLGVALGIPLAMLTGHFMGSMLFELEPYDRWTALASLVGVVSIGLAAGYLPARRAASIDPMQALRSE
ncbi:MAG TPA: ABC transporter permease [Acidobacteriaceae bacterium]|nr:ABC transporter permease [Acidobacteriaceae bacterium]